MSLPTIGTCTGTKLGLTCLWGANLNSHDAKLGRQNCNGGNAEIPRLADTVDDLIAD